MANDELAVLNQIKARLTKLAADMRKLGGKTNQLSQFITQEKAIREVRAIVRQSQQVSAGQQPLTAKTKAALEYIETEFVDLDDTLVDLPDSADKLKQVMAQNKALAAVRKRLDEATVEK